jgi:hypothetical protein
LDPVLFQKPPEFLFEGPPAMMRLLRADIRLLDSGKMT